MTEHRQLSQNSYAKRCQHLSPPVEELIEALKELTLKGALVYLASHGVKEFSKAGYEGLKKIIRDKQNDGKYAFVPNKEEANRLLSFAKNPEYQEINMLLPNYRYIDLIITGQLMDYYIKNPSKTYRERNREIKNQIANRPNGLKLLKIATLPTTPYFSLIVKVLYHLRKQGYSSVFLEEKFDEMVQDWTKTAKLVRSGDTVEAIMRFVQIQISKKSDIFFILGMKLASKKVEAVLAKIKEEKILETNNYSYRLTTSLCGVTPRVELMIFATVS